MNDTLIQTVIPVFFLTTVAMHTIKKNQNIAILYSLQSLVIAALLASVFIENGTFFLLLITMATLIVKVILAPGFFIRLVALHKLRFAASSYANLPLTLVIISLITAMASSGIFESLTNIVATRHTYLALALSSMLISIFLMVNRKGALSQIIGILSLENSIVLFAILAGLEQSAALQFGILFDISIWIFIAFSFVTMIYRHLGSEDVTNMRSLQD